MEIKIILQPDLSDDSGVLFYCYHGNWEQEGSGIVAELSRAGKNLRQKPK